MYLTRGVPSFILWFSQVFDYEVLKTKYSLMQHEWQCQQDTIGRLKIDVIKLRSQLNQQARFCSKLGSVFGYRLWKATRTPEVVNAMTQQVGNDMRDKRYFGNEQGVPPGEEVCVQKGDACAWRGVVFLKHNLLIILKTVLFWKFFFYQIYPQTHSIRHCIRNYVGSQHSLSVNNDYTLHTHLAAMCFIYLFIILPNAHKFMRSDYRLGEYL